MLRKLRRWLLRRTESRLPDHLALCSKYVLELDRLPKLRHPRRFTDHILRLMREPPNDLRRYVANKITLKDFVAERIGPGHTPQTYRRYATADAIVLDELPTRFVLKANHGSGFTRIVFDKAEVGEADLRQVAARWLASDFHAITREYIYQGYEREIFAEELLMSGGKICIDYKIFCFHGRTRMIEVVVDRDPTCLSHHCECFYDADWTDIDLSLGEPRSPPVPRPERLEEMLAIAARLSSDFDFMRVDLYCIGDRIYVGELTSFTHAGRMRFEPDWRDAWLGSFFDKTRAG